jgi:hypothetical protein
VGATAIDELQCLHHALVLVDLVGTKKVETKNEETKAEKNVEKNDIGDQKTEKAKEKKNTIMVAQVAAAKAQAVSEWPQLLASLQGAKVEIGSGEGGNDGDKGGGAAGGGWWDLNRVVLGVGTWRCTFAH